MTQNEVERVQKGRKGRNVGRRRKKEIIQTGQEDRYLGKESHR